MNKKIHLAIVIMACFFAVFLYVYKAKQKHYFSCVAHFQTGSNDVYMRAMFRLVFSGKEGIASMTGEVRDNEDRHLALNRKVLFTFRENNQHYILTSKKIINENFNEVDDSQLVNLLQPFYMKEKKIIHYIIVKQPNGDWVLNDGKLPIAYCHHS